MIEITRLEGLALFDGLAPAALRELAARGRIARYAEGETLWRAGTVSRGLFVILSGKVRVTSHAAGRAHRVHVEGPGAALGDVPLFDGGPYPASAVADVNTECAVFTRGGLRAAIVADPELAFRLLASLGRRVRGLIDRLDGVVGQDVRQRLAGRLHQIWKATEGDVVRLRSQADLAEELGTVREVVVRGLRQLEEAGAIERDGSLIRVLDAAALEALVG